LKLAGSRLDWKGLSATNVTATTLLNESGEFSDVDLGASQLQWKGLSATNFTATTLVINKVAEFKSMKMHLEGGPLHAEYRLDRSQPAWAHEVAIKGEQVRLAPLLGLFVNNDAHKPWVSAQKWGRLNAEVRIRWVQVPGQGWDWREVAVEGLDGADSDAGLWVTGASIKIPEGKQAVGIVPKIIKMVVDTLSIVLKAPKLRKAKVESAQLVGRISEGKIHARVHMRTPYYKAETGGVSALVKRLADLELNRVPVEVTVNPELAREIRLGGRLLNDKEMLLSVFMWLKGPSRDLQVEINEIVVAAIFTAALPNQVINVPVDLLEKTSGVIDKLPVPVNPLNFFFPRKE
jgi:hypothetical protein